MDARLTTRLTARVLLISDITDDFSRHFNLASGSGVNDRLEVGTGGLCSKTCRF